MSKFFYIRPLLLGICYLLGLNQSLSLSVYPPLTISSSSHECNLIADVAWPVLVGCRSPPTLQGLHYRMTPMLVTSPPPPIRAGPHSADANDCRWWTERWHDIAWISANTRPHDIAAIQFAIRNFSDRLRSLGRLYDRSRSWSRSSTALNCTAYKHLLNNINWLHDQTRKPSYRWQTRATREHAKNCSNSTCLQRCRWQFWPIVMRLAAVASKICEIPRNSLQIQTYEVQGHPMSSILVPIESPYATCY